MPLRDGARRDLHHPGPGLAASSSYPSGHSVLDWAWALVLSEMTPDRADEILARGLARGESRAISGVDYLSDVEAGSALAPPCSPASRPIRPSKRFFKLARRELVEAREWAASGTCHAAVEEAWFTVVV